MPDKLTDSEIKKALDICAKSTNGCSHGKHTCEDCYLNGQPMCSAVLLQDAKNLINYLRIENETVKALNGRLVVLADRFRSELKTAKAEAYKDFAERLKKALYSDSCRLVFESDLNIFECAIDNLLKEMLGGNETESALPPSRQAATLPSVKEAMQNFKSEEE